MGLYSLFLGVQERGTSGIVEDSDQSNEGSTEGAVALYAHRHGTLELMWSNGTGK